MRNTRVSDAPHATRVGAFPTGDREGGEPTIGTAAAPSWGLLLCINNPRGASMNFNIEVQDVVAEGTKIGNVKINVDYTADELRTLLVAYEKMIPMIIDLILKATQQPTA
jgi:hypothetical protein